MRWFTAAPDISIMLSMPRMRAPGARRAGIWLSSRSGRLGDHNFTAQRGGREVARRLRGGGLNANHQGGGQNTAKHGVDPGAVERTTARVSKARAVCGFGNLVALQGFEPRTCGL
jgi:hypothetical protein